MTYEMTQALGLPLEEGGILDQPHIWISECAIIKHNLTKWAAIRAMNARSEAEMAAGAN